MHKIANYTTAVTALKSTREIQEILVTHGAKRILMDYDEDSVPTALSFIISTPFGEMPFKLPANIDRIQAVLTKQHIRANVTRDLATRVAWRILKDWVRAQMAILEANMVSIDQIFLPYMQSGDGKTLYEIMIERKLELPEGRE